MMLLAFVVLLLIVWILVLQGRIRQLELWQRDQARTAAAHHAQAAAQAPTPVAVPPAIPHAAAQREATVRVHPPAQRPPRRPLPTLSSGQVFALAGGLFVLVGVITFITMAVSRGWISHLTQVLLGYAFGALVFAAGAAIGRRVGHNAATLVTVGVGSGIVQLVNVAGVQRYHEIDATTGLVIAIVAGAATVWFAVRRSSQLLAGFGMVTALGAPILVDAPVTTTTLVLLAAAMIGAVAVVMLRGWPWLGVTTLVVTFPQIDDWADAHGSNALPVTSLVIAWWALLVAAAIVYDIRVANGRLRTSNATLAFLSGGTASLMIVLTEHKHAAVASLLVLAALNFAAAIGLGVGRGARSRMAAVWLGVVGAGVLAIAFGRAFDGPARVPYWAIEAVALWAIHCRWRDMRAAIGAGVMGLLAVMSGLDAAPPDSFALEGNVDVSRSLLAIAPLILAGLAGAWLSARRLRTRHEDLTHAGLIASSVVAAATTPWLALHLGSAWATTESYGRVLGLGVVAALALLAVWRLPSIVTGAVATAELAFLSLDALIELLSPHDLGHGSADVTGTLLAGSLVITLLACAYLAGRRTTARAARPLDVLGAWPLSAAILLTTSILLVTAFTPTPGHGEAAQGSQLALSTYWGALGLAAIVAGLARRVVLAHRAGAALLAVAAAKVLLIDTQHLEAAYRTGVFIGVGLIMLVGGFAYLRGTAPPSSD